MRPEPCKGCGALMSMLPTPYRFRFGILLVTKNRAVRRALSRFSVHSRE
jgi:hypothetical protein